MKRVAIAGVIALIALAAACGSSDSTGTGAGPGDDGGATDDGGSSGSSGSSGTPPNPTPGCGPAVDKKGFVGSQSLSGRTYGLYVPDGYDGKTAYPIVVVFHGDGGTGDDIRSEYGKSLEAASSAGALFAYPDGQGQTWQTDDPTGLATDIGFFESIVSDLQKRYCTDAKRVFLTGFSRGAYFANQVACRTKTSLRGVATFSGGGPFGVQDSEFDSGGNLVCPSPPVGALQVHGDDDGPSEGMKSRDYWKGANGCTNSTSPYDPSPCVSYGGCAAGRPEIWCEIPGLGHAIWQPSIAATWKFFTSL
ncbi:MAG TPA: hypothetical protein VIF62_26485 [Labilithrix sp.]|jgi:polyhydroxybutyrate depolymerase